MTYNELREQLKNFVIFSLNDIRKVESNFDRRRLNEWQVKGYLKKVRRGFYIFSDIELNEQTMFLIANRIYNPSYISMEMAFSYYNLIPESVYGITSVTTKKTNSFKTNIASFIYRHFKPSLMFGYQLKKHQNQNIKIAEIEKALLDYLYINPQLKSEADFYEIRFNGQEFLAKANLAKLQNYLEVFNNQSLNQRVKKFLEFINEKPC